jgi:hypothetical protein
MGREGWIDSRPQMPTPPFLVLASCLFLFENDLNTATDGSQGVFKDRDFVITRNISSR